jgi:hypothetical protein
VAVNSICVLTVNKSSNKINQNFAKLQYQDTNGQAAGVVVLLQGLYVCGKVEVTDHDCGIRSVC